MDRGTFHGLLTLLGLLGFVAITLWAWGSGRKSEFERAARMPLDEDDHDRGDGR